ncbi:hypothetical protein AB0M64_21040, partial [Streptomyces sp. NPDC051771]
MIDFLNRNIFQPHPELLVFITVALGFLFGKLRYRAIALGAVTGCLVAGLLLGAQFKITIDATVKNLFFTLFLFALGYKVGPQFFRGLKKDGLPQVVNAIIVCVTGDELRRGQEVMLNEALNVVEAMEFERAGEIVT